MSPIMLLPFTFEVTEGRQPPKITIDGLPFAIVHCTLFWATATESTVGIKMAIVSGFLQGSVIQQNFRLVFSNNKAIEFHN